MLLPGNMTHVFNNFGTWEIFPMVVLFAILCWVVGLLGLFFRSRFLPHRFTWGLLIIGTTSIGLWISCLWFGLGRPPLRTLGETRVWYAFLLSILGFMVYFRWKIIWPIAYCAGMAILFLLITVFTPESYDKTLMPALQSPWFIPHVVVYLIAYAFLSVCSLIGIKGLITLYLNRSQTANIKTDSSLLTVADNMAKIGFAFLTLGLIFGALWAKEAWGHYWTWDPKETWAFITWVTYLIYLHLRVYYQSREKLAFTFLPVALIVLLLCWFGVNYMPSAQYSVHTYTDF